jgi:dolichyl-phosphate-mannose--protein O-mannosyl transferase
MLYVFFMSGDLLNISQQVLVLVGLAGVGSIGARWISTGTSGTVPATGGGFWGMFVVEGKPDLLRLQLFLFTLTIWVYVAARVFYEQAFPELDPNVLLLMGISNGLYVGGKWAATAAPTAPPN